MILSAAWRARWWLWALPLAVVLANVAILIVHPGRTGAGFADMQQELERETRALQSLKDKEKAVEAETPTLSIAFKPGARVKINEGTFENFEGEVHSIDAANGRVTVMINIFGRSTPVELEYWQVETV